MRIVMINDCAFVGETLIKYLPDDFEVVHLKRNRDFLSKTFGIAWKVLKGKGDLYHVHYLLQDCYLSSKFGKRPLIGHAHGSDIRNSLRHKVWGRIVRHNLKNCDKVLLSTPDLLDVAKKYRADVEYLPNPVDTSLFYLKPFRASNGKMKVLIACSANWRVKGTDLVIKALSRIKNEVNVSIIRYGADFQRTIALASSLGLRLNILPKVCHNKVNRYYWSADVVIGSIGAGALGMVALEAIACGRPVITYVSSQYPEYKDFPLKDVKTPNKIAEVLLTQNLVHLWKQEYEYLIKTHTPDKVIERVRRVYLQLKP